MAFMDLFRPKWKNSCSWKREAAVRALGNQAILATIAREEQHGGIRIIAVKKLSDKSIIAEVAEKDDEARVRWAAIARLSEQEAFARLAERCKYDEIREAAVRRLEDQVVLTRVARYDRCPSLRITAIHKLNDLNVLGELAKDNVYPNIDQVRVAAIGRLDDQRLLTEIARSDPDTEPRMAAVKKLTDEALLVDISKNDTAVCYVAIERLMEMVALRKKGIGLVQVNNPSLYDARERLVLPLLQILQESEYEVEIDAAVNAMKLLGKIGDSRAIGLILKYTQDMRPRIPLAAAEALGNLGEREAVPHLIEMFSQMDPVSGFTRKRWEESDKLVIARALCKIRDARAITDIADISMSLSSGSPEFVRVGFQEVLTELVSLVGQREEHARRRVWEEAARPTGIVDVD